MPFYRKHLKDTLIKYLKPMNLIWHPVCDPVDIEPFQNNTIDWIQPCLCPPLKIPGETAYKKVNDFVETNKIIDDDYYGFVGDDDMYQPGFIDKIKKQSAEIIVYSASRGEVTPNDSCPYKWPPIDLKIEKLEDIRIANIDFCQMIVKGNIFKQMRFGIHDVCDDGHYAEGLRNRWPDKILILPEIGVNKNFFQPGRYTVDRGYTF